MSRDIVFKKNLQDNDPLVSVSPDDEAENFVIFGPAIIGSDKCTEDDQIREIVAEPVTVPEFNPVDEKFVDFENDSESETMEEVDTNDKWHSFVSSRTRNLTVLAACMENGDSFVSVKEPHNGKWL